ncbi:MAG TPA: NF038129 family PEP-CTERM protein [Casimicrobiaceae bacterium]|nr:NF038129 family PEP-CTERM protein [Casimicrobiaceae bacterium]
MKRFPGMFAILSLLLLAQQSAQAGVVTGSVSLDTSALAGTYEIAFVFTDGSGAGDANNTVTLSDFLFGAGGSPGTVDASLSAGGVGGDLASGASLIDSAFLNIFASSFTPGSVLSFDFALTTNVDPGGTPDQLSMVLLGGDGTPVASTDPSGADSLLTVDIDSTDPVFATFASDLTPAPIVTEATTVPEPPSLVLLIMAFGLLLSERRRASAGR